MSAKKIIFFSNIKGNIGKFIDVFTRIKDKSGNFDMIVLTGHVFDLDKDFSQIIELVKLKTKILIFDDSEVGIIAKHKLFYESYSLNEYVTLLGRSGVYIFDDIRIAYINGKEHKKYLSEDESYKYTSSYFSREDFDKVSEQCDKVKTDILLINSIPSLIYEELIK